MVGKHASCGAVLADEPQLTLDSPSMQVMLSHLHKPYVVMERNACVIDFPFLLSLARCQYGLGTHEPIAKLRHFWD